MQAPESELTRLDDHGIEISQGVLQQKGPSVFALPPDLDAVSLLVRQHCQTIDQQAALNEHRDSLAE